MAAIASFRPQQQRFPYHRSSVAAASVAAAHHKSQAVCKFWLQGRCNRGDSCRFSHGDKAVAPAAAPLPPKRSNCWVRPSSAPEVHHQEAPHHALQKKQPQLMEVEESVAAPILPQPVNDVDSITEAAASDSMVDSSNNKDSSSAADTTAIATGGVEESVAAPILPQPVKEVDSITEAAASDSTVDYSNNNDSSRAADTTAIATGGVEESVATAILPQPVKGVDSITEAAASDSTVDTSNNNDSSSAADTTATATGVSSVCWPLLVVTAEDGSICVQDKDRLHERRVHRIHSPITCVVDCPVQQQVHPGLLVVGLASGEVALVSFTKAALDMNVYIIAGPSQPCGKVLSIVSAFTPLHPFLIIAGYENGAVLCWTRSTVSSFTPLCALQYPTSASVISMDISEFEEEDIIGGGHKKKQLLYSSSTDGSISVWDLEAFTRLQKQPAASQVVITKLLAAGRYLFCGCADGTIQAWGPTATSSMELLHTQASPRQGAATAVVDLCGQNKEDGRHMLYAAYNDNTVSMWELPTFKEMDVIRVPFGIRAMDFGTYAGAVLLLAGTSGLAMGVQL